MPENIHIVLSERPRGEIVPGKTFRQESRPVPTEKDLKDGQILVENLYLGLDPAARGWLNDVRSYVEPVKIGDTMRGGTVSRVIASKSEKASPGDIISAFGGWCHYNILDDATIQPASTLPPVSKPYQHLSGLTRLTAYFGMLEIGNPQPGETVVVSGAAGATGSIAGQIAKIKGARVVGIAGSDDKCRWLVEELGFDVALNYKDPEYRRKFREATPKHIDLYFDNVGGETLDLALSRAKEFARFVECGMISQYNATEAYNLKHLTSIVMMRIQMRGFIVLDYAKQFREAREQISKWQQEGKLKSTETVVPGGVGVIEQTFADLYKGVNTGKLIVEIKKPEESSKL